MLKCSCDSLVISNRGCQCGHIDVVRFLHRHSSHPKKSDVISPGDKVRITKRQGSVADYGDIDPEDWLLYDGEVGVVDEIFEVEMIPKDWAVLEFPSLPLMPIPIDCLRPYPAQ